MTRTQSLKDMLYLAIELDREYPKGEWASNLSEFAAYLSELSDGATYARGLAISNEIALIQRHIAVSHKEITEIRLVVNEMLPPKIIITVENESGKQFKTLNCID